MIDLLSITFQTIRTQQLPLLDKTEENEAETEKDTEELQAQNENLLQIIHQMREDMEDLTKQLSQRTADSGTNTKSGVPITEGI